jgi:hypothetical protein
MHRSVNLKAPGRLQILTVYQYLGNKFRAAGRFIPIWLTPCNHIGAAGCDRIDRQISSGAKGDSDPESGSKMADFCGFQESLKKI